MVNLMVHGMKDGRNSGVRVCLHCPLLNAPLLLLHGKMGDLHLKMFAKLKKKNNKAQCTFLKEQSTQS